MQLAELRVFVTVANERSFSKAAARLHRTQPAISQAVRRLEDLLGERLFDRSAKDGKLTDAGRVLFEYAERLIGLSEEAERAVRELRDLRRGRVVIGSNEAAVHVLLPLVASFRRTHPRIQVEVRRMPSRTIGAAVVERGLDFGVISFAAAEAGLDAVVIGADEFVMLVHPAHPLAGRAQVSMGEFARETVVAHNETSPARERVLRLFEQRHEPINIQVALPSIDAIKRAVEMSMGVALLPRRCATAELARGTLAAVHVAQVRMPRQLRLVYRAAGQRSAAAEAFLAAAREYHDELSAQHLPVGPPSRPRPDARAAARARPGRKAESAGKD